MLQVVMINGSGLRGKDKFIHYVSEHCKGKAAVCNYSTITQVKNICEVAFGVSPENKTDAARCLWSDVKDAWIKFNDGPAQEAIKIIMETYDVSDDKSVVIFVHCREPDEIKKIVDGIRRFAKIHTLLVLRDGVPVPNCKKDLASRMMTHDYDRVIINDSLEKLKADAIKYSVDVLQVV